MSEAMELYKQGKGNHPGGRPTKYNPAIMRKTKHYLKHYSEYDDKVPSVAGLACALDLAKDTVYDWIKHPDKKEFSDCIKRLMTSQERALISSGLSNTFNAKITNLLLSQHGYTERVDTASQGITVNVSRGNVQIQSGNESLTIKDIDTEQVTIEHEDNQS